MVPSSKDQRASEDIGYQEKAYTIGPTIKDQNLQDHICPKIILLHVASSATIVQSKIQNCQN